MSCQKTPSIKITIGILALAGLVMTARAEGFLTVKTDPDGIEVWLDEKFLGQSPIIEKKIKAGRYSLKLIDPAQHSSTNEEVFIQDGDTVVIDRTITSKFGSLKVDSDPEGADVAIATDLGKTPLTNDFMNPGKYRIEIRAPNSRYCTSAAEITIPKGETVSINQKLKKKKFLTKKNIASLLLFSGSAGGFIWGIAEQGRFRMYKQQQRENVALATSPSKADGAALGRTFGIIIGSGCLIGLEIVALF